MTQVGIMQGRLLNAVNGQIQEEPDNSRYQRR